MLTLINTHHQIPLEYNKDPVSAYSLLHVYNLASTSDTATFIYKETLINQLVLFVAHRSF